MVSDVSAGILEFERLRSGKLASNFHKQNPALGLIQPVVIQ